MKARIIKGKDKGQVVRVIEKKYLFGAVALFTVVGDGFALKVVPGSILSFSK